MDNIWSHKRIMEGCNRVAVTQSRLAENES